MLEFIVLGNVPGTHFNITFSWILALTAVFLIVLEVRYHKNYALKVQSVTTETTPTATSSPKKSAVKKTKSATKRKPAKKPSK